MKRIGIIMAVMLGITAFSAGNRAAAPAKSHTKNSIINPDPIIAQVHDLDSNLTVLKQALR